MPEERLQVSPGTLGQATGARRARPADLSADYEADLGVELGADLDVELGMDLGTGTEAAPGERLEHGQGLESIARGVARGS